MHFACGHPHQPLEHPAQPAAEGDLPGLILPTVALARHPEQHLPALAGLAAVREHGTSVHAFADGEQCLLVVNTRVVYSIWNTYAPQWPNSMSIANVLCPYPDCPQPKSRLGCMPLKAGNHAFFLPNNLA